MAALLQGTDQPAAAARRTIDKAVVHPVAYKVLATPSHVLPVMVAGGGLALRDLILMVREHLHWHSMLTEGAATCRLAVPGELKRLHKQVVVLK